MKTQDVLYMQRALDLAERGRGTVSPNPMVGCVIEHDNRIIGEGWHQQYGEAHAEVNAVNSVEARELLSESTCYVTLEPCAHYGQTPPCADLLVEHQLKRVVVAVKDSNPLVGGKGIEKLRAAGIQVDYGILEEKARTLNCRFFTAMEKQRPYIVLKWARTSDGFIARKNFDSKWISGESSRQLVHQWRADEDAIMVGTNTALHDDPQLNVRGLAGKNPLRVVIDRRLKLPKTLRLFDGSQPTLCYNLIKSEVAENLEYVKLDQDDFLSQLMADLYKRKVQSVFVEGGAALLASLIHQGLWDEARVFGSDSAFGSGINAPELPVGVAESITVMGDELRVFHRN